MPSGGKREGAGRPKKADKFARPIAKVEKRCADHLPQVFDNLKHLADGGYERVTETWEPAGLQTIKLGEATVKAFPDLKDDQLVLIKKTVTHADKDRQANIYLMDRILGTPTERTEISGDQGGPIRLEALDAALAKIYPAAPAPAPETVKVPAPAAKKPTTRSKAKATPKSKAKRKPKAK